MAATDQQGLPLGEQPSHAVAERKGRHFGGGEPPEFVTFGTRRGDSVFGRDEDEADVVVKVGRFVVLGGDLVDVEIEGPRGCHNETVDAGFFQCFATGDAENVLIAVAMAAELKPFVQLAVMMEEGAGTVGADYQCAAGEMGGEGIAAEAAGRRIEEADHLLAEGFLDEALGEVERGELGAKFGTIHGGVVKWVELRCGRISAEEAAKKLLGQRDAFTVVKLRAAMDAAVDGLELNQALGLPVSRLKGARLLEWRLWVLVAVDQEQGRILGIHMEYGAGKAGEFRRGIGLGTEEKLQGRDADGEAVGRGLLENGGEVRHSEKAQDGVNVRGLIGQSDGAFKFAMAVGDADERGEMSSGGGSGDGDLVGVDTQFFRVGTQEANGGLDVVDLGGKPCGGGEAVIDAGNGIALGDELAEGHVFAGTGTPGAAVDPDDDLRPAGVWGQMQVESKGVSIHFGKPNALTDVGGGVQEGNRGRNHGGEQE